MRPFLLSGILWISKQMVVKGGAGYESEEKDAWRKECNKETYSMSKGKTAVIKAEAKPVSSSSYSHD